MRFDHLCRHLTPWPIPRRLDRYWGWRTTVVNAWAPACQRPASASQRNARRRLRLQCGDLSTSVNQRPEDPVFQLHSMLSVNASYSPCCPELQIEKLSSINTCFTSLGQMQVQTDETVQTLPSQYRHSRFPTLTACSCAGLPPSASRFGHGSHKGALFYRCTLIIFFYSAG